MSFSRANGSTWAVGDKVTSAQLNQLDADHALALDKSAAGDTLSGVVTIGSGGQILSAQAAGVKTTTSGGLQLGGAGRSGLADIQHEPHARRVPADCAHRQPDGVDQRGRRVTLLARSRHDRASLLRADATAQRRNDDGGHCEHHRQGLALRRSGQPPYIAQRDPPVADHRRIRLRCFDRLRCSREEPLRFRRLPPERHGTIRISSSSGSSRADQNNVIDTSNNVYYFTVVDEHGSNSVSGNLYVAFAVAYGSIPNMKFP